jgi:hypothetical protein
MPDIVIYIQNLHHTASYTPAVSLLLKVFHLHLIHMMCLAFAMNRLAEQIRNKLPKLTNLISDIKELSCKAPSNIGT